MTLALPRDELSVPVVRRLLTTSLDVLGVEPADVSDIEIALTEACTNVLDHVAAEENYEVSAGISGDTCVIEVIDRGGGFDHENLGRQDAAHGAEDGRGIQLMRALMDKLEFDSQEHDGTVVHLEKRLRWQEGAAVNRLR